MRISDYHKGHWDLQKLYTNQRQELVGGEWHPPSLNLKSTEANGLTLVYKSMVRM